MYGLMKKTLCIIFVLLMAFSVMTNKAYAASKTVFETGVAVKSSETKRIDFDPDTVVSDLTSEGVEMIVGQTYEALYVDALDYFEKTLSVKVEATLLSYEEIDEDGHIKIKLNPSNLVSTDWKNVYNINTKIVITFLDGDTPYKVTLLTGLADPDESNYLFDVNRHIYFRDAEKSATTKPGDANDAATAAKAYLVMDDGFYRANANGELLDRDTIKDVNGYEEALFLLGLENESKFEFNTFTHAGGSIRVPYFYSLDKSWKVYYNLNDKTGTKAVNDSTNPDTYKSPLGEAITIKDPTREGYEFIEWVRTESDWKGSDANTPEDNHMIQRWDVGDKYFLASWKAIPQPYTVEYYYMDDQGKYPTTPTEVDESREAPTDSKVTVTDRDKTPGKDNYALDESEDAKYVYEEIVKADGSTVLKVYFKKSYTVTYEPGTHGDFEEQVNPNLDHGVDTPEFKGEPIGKPGYDFIGWDKEIADTVTENATYIAQWDPWKYIINYNPNGGSGEMNSQVFTYDDDSMVSKKNQFTRDGYDFIGFEFTYDGAKYIITSTKDFNDMLKELGPNSEITLVAQWKKLPDPVVKYYPIPVTGVE